MDLKQAIVYISSQTKYNSDEIRQMIHHEIDELSGLIDEEGAINIVASNLGMNLYSFFKKKYNLSEKNMGTIHQVIEGAEPNDVTFIKAAMVLWRSPKKGPHPGKNGEWYSFDLLVSDGSVPKDAEGKDGRFVSFGDHPSTDDIKTDDTVEFKLRYNSFFSKKKQQTELSLKGSYLKKSTTMRSNVYAAPSAPSGKITPPADNAYKLQVEEYQSLIKEVIDPLFNKLWDRLPKDQQTEFYNANMGLVKAINRYLPE